MRRAYQFLMAAIVAEVIASLAMKANAGFTRLAPSVVTILGYGVAFYCESLCLKAGMQVGTVYAIWSGAGIVLVTLAGVALYQERIDWPAALGLMLIAAGIAVLQLFSKAGQPH